MFESIFGSIVSMFSGAAGRGGWRKIPANGRAGERASERSVVTKRINRGSRDHVNPCAHRDLFLSQPGRQSSSAHTRRIIRWTYCHSECWWWRRFATLAGVAALLHCCCCCCSVHDSSRSVSRHSSVLSSHSADFFLPPRCCLWFAPLVRTHPRAAAAAEREWRQRGCSCCGGRAAVVVANWRVQLPCT